MNRDDIIRMAREANFYESEIGGNEDGFVHFASLVAAAEREACATVCDEQGRGRKALEHYAALTYSGAAYDCARAIRARKENT